MPALRARWPALEARKWLSAPDPAWRALADGDRVRAGDRELLVIHTPGHAPDHICFWDPTDRALFAGDMLAIGTTVMIPAGRGGNLRTVLWRRSGSMDGARSRRGPIPGTGRSSTSRAISSGRTWRIARCARIQILACLEDGVTDVDAIVARIYGELTDPVKRAARETVIAHLEKLREDEAI